MDRLTLEFSNADIERDFLLADFRQSHHLVIIFSFTMVFLMLAFLVAFPAVWPAAPFVLPQFGIIGGVRLFVARLDDEWHALLIFCWTWLGVAVLVFATWLVTQASFVMLSGLSATCLFFIAVLLCLTSCFLNMLVGSFLPRMLTLVVYSIGWACTSPRISVLVGPLEPLLMCSAVVLGGLIGHTMSHTRRIVHLAAQFEIERRVELAISESENAAEEARQLMALRFAEALRYINDVVIELGVASADADDIRKSVVMTGSASFHSTFGREINHTPGLLFELVDPADSAKLERLLISAASSSSGGEPSSDNNNQQQQQQQRDGALMSSVAFVKPDGTRRRLQLQVVRIQQPMMHRVGSSSTELNKLGEMPTASTDPKAPGVASSRSSNNSTDPVHAVSLVVVCHDLSDALRQAERVIEQKAHRVLNHTAKRVMANTVQCCRMAMEQLRSLPLPEQSPGGSPISGGGSGSNATAQATVENVLGLLNTTLSESVTGYHMCRNAIIQTSIESGDHSSLIEHFRLSQLFDDLGFAHHKRITLQDTVGRTELRGDLQILSCILFNAAHNALMHGVHGVSDVVIETRLEESADEEGEGSFSFGRRSRHQPAWLHVTIRNAAGANHAALRAMGVDDLLEAAPTTVSRLREQGAGAEGSTFLGLTEIYRAARTIEPHAEVHLWVEPEEVRFELRMPLKVIIRLAPEPKDATESIAAAAEEEVVADTVFQPCFNLAGVSSPGSAEQRQTPALPPGLVFVCCDDDDMPRFFAEQVLLPVAQADAEASRVLGDTYESAKHVPDLVMELAERHGHDRIYCLFDQNLTNYHEGAIYGTSLCRELRQRGFSGCLVIQSANDEITAEREYLAAGANGCIGKVLRGGPEEIVSRIAALFWDAHGSKALSREGRGCMGTAV